jgi:DNA polymerase III epsilon subunit-like protein
MSKLIFIDTETTGVVRERHEIVQLAAIVTNEDASEVLDEINISIRPEMVDTIDPAAIAVCHKTVDDLLANEYSMKEAHKVFCEFLGKHINKYDRTDKGQFVAYNSPFDEDFVRLLFDRCGDDYYGSWFWNPSLCVMREFAFLIRDNRHKIENFRLCTICEFLDIEFDEDNDAHDALYDVRKTIEIFKKLI